MTYPQNRELLLVLALTFSWPALTHAEILTINLTGGSVIEVEAPDQAVEWTTINAKGEIEEVTVDLSEIKKIELSNHPARVQALAIKRLLDQLEEIEQDNASPAVRKRVKQAIDSFRFSKPQYDYLYLKDGKVLIGDIGEFTLNCKFQDQDFELKRKVLRRVSITPAKIPVAKAGPLSVQLLHRHEKELFADPDRVVDFETDTLGNKLVSGSEISNTFVNRGIIFEAEEKDFIGISGFPLKFRGFPTGGNSICPIEKEIAYAKKFRGVTRISFCNPGLPDAPAGVRQFGFFASRIDNPRDLIMEAYNADSQMIGCVESTDQNMVFLGIESNEPIAFVRVLSNPYLADVSRRVDETYVIDHVLFGEPVSLDDAKLSRVGGQLNTVVLSTGDILSVKELSFTPTGIQVYEPEMSRRMKFTQEEIHSIRFGGHQGVRLISNATSQLRMPDPSTKEWAVMLTDGSVLAVEPGETFSAKLFKGMGLSPEHVAGFWAMQDPVRLPMADDFIEGKDVLVFPTCRIVSKVKMTDTKVSWENDDAIIEQPIFSKEPTEDVTPKFESFPFSRKFGRQLPTIWFRQPQVAQSKWGAIHLVDGQKIVLGSDLGFKIGAIDDESISVVGKDGMKVGLPVTQVLSIEFPK